MMNVVYDEPNPKPNMAREVMAPTYESGKTIKIIEAINISDECAS